MQSMPLISRVRGSVPEEETSFEGKVSVLGSSSTCKHTETTGVTER